MATSLRSYLAGAGRLTITGGDRRRRHVVIGGNFSAPAGIIEVTVSSSFGAGLEAYRIFANQYASFDLAPNQGLSVQIIAGSPPVPFSVAMTTLEDS